MSLTNASFSKKNNSKYASFFACVFAFLLAFCLVPSFAYADVKNSDIILGESVESQGFTVADARVSMRYMPMLLQKTEQYILNALRILKPKLLRSQKL